MDQLTVFTAVMGYTDPLHEPPSGSNSRFICFTDRNLRSEGWEIIRVEPQETPKRLSRQIKALSHEYLHTKWSLWIDCCFDIVVPPENLIGYGDFVTFSHAERNNVYAESQAVIRLKKAKLKTVMLQMNAYKEAGFPIHGRLPKGLSCTGVTLRHHTDKVCAINTDWYKELSTHSLRDQLSLDYVFWKHQYLPTRWPGTHDKNPYFKYTFYNRPVNDF